MNPLVLFLAFLLMRDVRATVELDCSDNATCIEHMAKEVIKSVRDQRTLKLFNVLTIEPLKTRQARMARSMDSWLETFLDGNAFSFDWNDYTFKVSQADDSNALDLEILQGRTAKDVSDPNGKKSSTKNEEEKEEDKTPKLPGHRRPSPTTPGHGSVNATISPVTQVSAGTQHGSSHQTQNGLGQPTVSHTTQISGSLSISPNKHRRRRHKKKVMQMIIPMFFGMKSAGVVMFAMAVVTVLTLKAFMASKVALLVTVGMAAKKLYETYGTGVGLQNHPYLYSQYPIDFPSASSHAYSVSGVSPQFASPEMYSPTGMGAHSQTNEIMHQGDATAQQSQQAPTLLVNSTRAAERWDGKSILLKYFEPLIEGVRSIVDPIANVFYGAMPATVRGLNSDVSTTNSIDPDDDLDELEIVKKPRQFLVPQPRNIAQRKMSFKKERKDRNRPKKYSELKISLDRLKNNKDLQDYIRTKKYKYNYPNTFFYPRVKYFVNPNMFLKPNNSRLMPYNKEPSNIVNTTVLPIITRDTEWKPIVFLNHTFPKNNTKKHSKRNFRKRHYKKRRNRTKRSIDINEEVRNGSARSILSRSDQSTARFTFGFLKALFENDPIGKLVKQTAKYMKSKIDHSLESDEPGYYSLAYNIVMMTLDVMEGIFEVNAALDEQYKTKKLKRKKDDATIKYVSNCTQVEKNVESKGNGTQH